MIRWNAAAANYDLWTSNNPASLTQVPANPATAGWTEMQSVTGNTQNAFTATYPGLNFNGRYVMMYGHNRVANYGYSIDDFRVFGAFSADPTAAPTVNGGTATGTVGSAFSFQISATQNPTSFNATGLPAGLTVNTTTGVISGTPTAAGTSAVTITASNATGSGSATLTLTVSNPAGVAPSITSALTATTTAGSAFTYQITGSQDPTGFNATGLPASLTVNTTTGVISGTPTAAETTNVTITATNAFGTGTATLSLTVNAAAIAPSTPTNLTATAGNAQVTLSWTTSTGASSYNIFRGTSAGGEDSVPLATNVSAPPFIDTTATNGTTYFYTVEAVNTAGASQPSNEVSATPAPQSSNGAPIYQIGAGRTSGVAPFVGDEFFSGGGTSTSGATISTAKVVNPAPMQVYQSARFGTFTYTIPSLTPQSTYTMRLHFAETYWTQASQRVFNVAVVEQFQTTADSNGNITVTYTAGTADQPKASALEVYQQ